MKTILILIASLSFSITAIGQKEWADSSFTNKSEAKNKTVNGLKEGKWCEYIKVSTHGKGADMRVSEKITTHPKKATMYRLTIYKDGKPEGVMRTYYKDGKLEGELIYVNGKRNGTAKIYYPNGKLSIENPFVNDKISGVRKIYSQDGKLVVADTIAQGGAQHGVVMAYDSEGRLKSETLYTKDSVNGSGNISVPSLKMVLYNVTVTLIKVFYPDGKISVLTTFNMVTHKPTIVQYDENGKVISEKPVPKGN